MIVLFRLWIIHNPMMLRQRKTRKRWRKAMKVFTFLIWVLALLLNLLPIICSAGYDENTSRTKGDKKGLEISFSTPSLNREPQRCQWLKPSGGLITVGSNSGRVVHLIKHKRSRLKDSAKVKSCSYSSVTAHAPYGTHMGPIWEQPGIGKALWLT